MELKYWKNKAESYYINHPVESFAVIMINDAGDLMINSDWGLLVFAWRNMGENYKTFLIGLEEGYWKSKMTTNLLNIGVPKKRITNTIDHVWPIFQQFQLLLKMELAGNVIEVKAPKY